MTYLMTMALGLMFVALGSRPVQAQSPTSDAHISEFHKTAARSPCLGIEVGGSPSAWVDEQDSLALVALYDATDGDNWTNKTNWLTGPVASWYGVQVVGDSVVVLDFAGNGLSGSLPPELGNLSDLRVLQLIGNTLSGSLPPELGKLVNLSCLELSSTQISGLIPPELGNLINLQNLMAFGTQLSGPIPSELGNLTSLSWLVLTENQLSGPIPSELGNLTNLSVLSFYGLQLSGSIPSELGELANLINLVLSKNQLSGSIPPELGNLTNLRGLYISDNQLSGPIPMTFTNLDSLSTFEFFNTNLCEPVDPAFQNWLQGVAIVRNTGVCTATTKEAELNLPTKYTLSHSYPNPFYGTTRIRYGLPQSASVSLKVYDIQGRAVRIIVHENQSAGWHEVIFEGGMLPGGVYFYHFESGNFHAVRQMVLLR